MLPHQNPKPPAWYFKFWGIIVLLILFGPLAYPFLWKSKTFSVRLKIILTVVFTVLTIWITMHVMAVFNATLEQFRRSGLVP